MKRALEFRVFWDHNQKAITNLTATIPSVEESKKKTKIFTLLIMGVVNIMRKIFLWKTALYVVP